jgi:hypothetical protein
MNTTLKRTGVALLVRQSAEPDGDRAPVLAVVVVVEAEAAYRSDEAKGQDMQHTGRGGVDPVGDKLALVNGTRTVGIDHLEETRRLVAMPGH